MFSKRNKQEIRQYLSMDIFLCLWLLYILWILYNGYFSVLVVTVFANEKNWPPQIFNWLHFSFFKNTYSPLICWTIVLINFQRVVWNGQQDGKCFQEPWNQKRRCRMYLHASQSISCCCHVGLCKNWCTSQVKTY